MRADRIVLWAALASLVGIAICLVAWCLIGLFGLIDRILGPDDDYPE